MKQVGRLKGTASHVIAISALFFVSDTSVLADPPAEVQARKEKPDDPVLCMKRTELAEAARRAMLSCLDQPSPVSCVARSSAKLVKQREITGEQRQAVLVCVSESINRS